VFFVKTQARAASRPLTGDDRPPRCLSGDGGPRHDRPSRQGGEGGYRGGFKREGTDGPGFGGAGLFQGGGRGCPPRTDPIPAIKTADGKGASKVK
jgi:hypothetical protein